MDKCPICDKSLRKNTIYHKNDKGKNTYIESYTDCPRCKQYHTEYIGCNGTLWIKDKEYYGMKNKDFDIPKIRLNISMCRIFYKIHKKLQKVTKMY